MSDDRPYRLCAMEIAGMAGRVTNTELAIHYRTLAAAYMALARFHERVTHRGLPAMWEDQHDPNVPSH